MIARGGKKVWKQYRTPPEMKRTTVKRNIVKVRCGKHLDRRQTVWSVFEYCFLFESRPVASTKGKLVKMWADGEKELVKLARVETWQN